MNQALNTTAKRLPTWVLTLLSISIISYVFAMSAVAIMTERDVSFLPPKIGPGPKQAIVEELGSIRNEIKLLNSEFKLQIETVNVNLAEARKQSAITRQNHSVLVYLQWDDVVKEYEDDRKKINEIYIGNLKKLDDRILGIEENIKKHLMM